MRAAFCRCRLHKGLGTAFSNTIGSRCTGHHKIGFDVLVRVAIGRKRIKQIFVLSGIAGQVIQVGAAV